MNQTPSWAINKLVPKVLSINIDGGFLRHDTGWGPQHHEHLGPSKYSSKYFSIHIFCVGLLMNLASNEYEGRGCHEKNTIYEKLTLWHVYLKAYNTGSIQYPRSLLTLYNSDMQNLIEKNYAGNYRFKTIGLNADRCG